MRALFVLMLCVAVAYAALLAISLTKNYGVDPRPTGANWQGLNLHQGGVGSYETPKPMLFK